MNWHTAFTIVHIGAGALALLSGIPPMLTAKGNKLHRRTGKVYSRSMLVVMLTAMVLSVVLPLIYGTQLKVFLFVIGLFSYYFVFSGLRALKYHKPPKSKSPKWSDKTAAALLLLGGIFLIGYNIYLNALLSPNPILVGFGIFAIVMAVGDLRRFQRPFDAKLNKFRWFYMHLGRMVGSYIAAFTAFVVVNVDFLPAIIVWAAPGIVGGIGITVWIRYYKRKFEGVA